MNNRKNLGYFGEDIASNYLEKQGYEIIERNFRCNCGEIDIISKDKDELVFVEVKTRTQDEYGTPAESVDANKEKHIYKAGEYYLYSKEINDAYCRLDVIEVLITNREVKVHHIKQAILDKPTKRCFDSNISVGESDD